ncbi:MAG: hypothetical protein AUG04_06255 [Deltaproteobacteria bacterium 13_1_20CM_2_69_21]|nr:MAG: hypothetical protein AUG04_06255 [Deltaproteobacteria bacterium 13_1_20CM_2_69_21]
MDFEREQVNVVRAYSLDEITETKGKRRRDVPLPPDALAALRHWKQVTGDHELVFSRPDGTRLDHKECEDEFKDMWFLAGLRGCKLQRPSLPVHLDSKGIEKFLTYREEGGA